MSAVYIDPSFVALGFHIDPSFVLLESYPSFVALGVILPFLIIRILFTALMSPLRVLNATMILGLVVLSQQSCPLRT